jgi:GH15 family glucan-1,4-alpha-glucosidase
MSALIEDYGLIGDLQTAALVSRHGSMDWLCLPRFDSAACLAALLGDEENGRWVIAPVGDFRATSRRYRGETLILESEMETDDGAVRVIDLMKPREGPPVVLRVVEGLRGRVRMRSDVALRFDYGSIVPWVRHIDGGIHAIAGPDAVSLRSDVEMVGRDLHTVAEFSLPAGEQVSFELCWFPSTDEPPPRLDARAAVEQTERFWTAWAGHSQHEGEWHAHIQRSLVTLKALTYAPTGGIVAAPTTSLPEKLGGVRNWDYRFCWLRDATLTLLSFLRTGYREEARAWRDWFVRAIAGSPEDAQIMYGIAGERRLLEWEAPWLAGYEGSRPVRIGNKAADQLQLDVYGEVADALYHARVHGLDAAPNAWAILRHMLDWLEGAWREEDNGIWEVRGPRRHFTHSKVMAWVAFDRGIRLVERFGREGPVERWRHMRDEIHAEVLARGYDPRLRAFTQTYGSERLDASLLMIPLVGFLPADDERMVGTVAAIERGLTTDGLVERYRADEHITEIDGLPPGEGAFLPCSFWLAEVLAMQGRRDDARRLFERLLGLSNDLGLLAEEYDTAHGRQVGNFPQAFTHLALVDAGYLLASGRSARLD